MQGGESFGTENSDASDVCHQLAACLKEICRDVRTCFYVSVHGAHLTGNLEGIQWVQLQPLASM